MSLLVLIQHLTVLILVAVFAILWADWPENYVPWLRSVKQKFPPAMQLKYLLVLGILITLFLMYIDFNSVGLL
jgi:hypothetical protein